MAGLKKLVLARAGITKVGCTHFEQATFAGLEHLDIGHNATGPDCANSLAKSPFMPKLAALIAPLSSLLVVRLQGRLGEQLHPRATPLTSGQRAWTLALICNLPMAILYAGSAGLAGGWNLEQATIAASALPVLAIAPITAAMATRWWSNAGHLIPFLCLLGFFTTRLPSAIALAVGSVLGGVSVWLLVRLLEKIRERTL